jgi:hypothetical protein
MTRHFYKDGSKVARFSSFDWTNWDKVIHGFEKRLEEWYFCHLRCGDESYVHFCALCALVDAFTYYDGDKDWHDPKAYKEFLSRQQNLWVDSGSGSRPNV